MDVEPDVQRRPRKDEKVAGEREIEGDAFLQSNQRPDNGDDVSTGLAGTGVTGTACTRATGDAADD